MDWQTVFNLLGTGVLGLIGWFVKDVKDELKAARSDSAANDRALAEFKVIVATNYVRNEALDKIDAALVRIEQKIDRKVDK